MEIRLPVLFSAHGNPVNALGETPFSDCLARWGRSLPRPRALLVVSAHWQMRRLAVTAADQPDTIHDFYGFPPVLFTLDYPAPGDPGLAEEVRLRLLEAGFEATNDLQRGRDHGTWVPLRLLYPEADLPVLQLSLLFGAPPARHIEMGRVLAPLREEGVLIVGSGNVVHNTAAVDLRRRDLPVAPWAVEFDAWVKGRLDAWDLEALAAFPQRAPHAARAHLTSEHFEPLLVACGAADGETRPRVQHVFEGFEHGTLSMRCVQFD